MAGDAPAARPVRAISKDLSVYDLVIGLLALLSLIVLALLAFAPLSADTKDALGALENGLCAVFLFDFFRSLRRAPAKWDYFGPGGGWLDLLGSIPFSAFALFRVFRLFRIVRVVRTLRGSQFREILLERLAESALLFTLVVALILIFTVAGVVAWAENGAPHANIETYRDAVWWGFVTITTVGYGDFYPVTAVGRVSAVVLMFCGLAIIGVLSSYLATTFIALQARRAARGKAEAASSDSMSSDGRDGRSNSDAASPAGAAPDGAAELGAIRDELTALRRLVEERC